MVDSAKRVIIDNGSAMMKAGLAGDIAPAVHIPTIVGQTDFEGIDKKERSNYEQEYIGDEALEKINVCDFKYPI